MASTPIYSLLAGANKAAHLHGLQEGQLWLVAEADGSHVARGIPEREGVTAEQSAHVGCRVERRVQGCAGGVLRRVDVVRRGCGLRRIASLEPRPKL